MSGKKAQTEVFINKNVKSGMMYSKIFKACVMLS